MASKLAPGPIVASDLEQYLRDESDFAFELSVHEVLSAAGLDVSHGGTYVDPHTKFAREYDIQAHTRGGDSCLYLAVECKNVGENFPVLVTTAPRERAAAFHCVWTQKLAAESQEDPLLLSTFHYRHVGAARLSGDATPFRENKQVGKDIAQIGRDKNGELSASDAGLYTKWAQALGSASSLVRRAYFEVDRAQETRVFAAAVVPIVVVPDQRLWAADYSSLGKVTAPPRQVQRVPYYVGYEARVDLGEFAIRYDVSHVEFMTISELKRITMPRPLEDPLGLLLGNAIIKQRVHDLAELG